MLEATPGKPWGIEFKELLNVEPNMKLRYFKSITTTTTTTTSFSELIIATGDVLPRTICYQMSIPSP